MRGLGEEPLFPQAAVAALGDDDVVHDLHPQDLAGPGQAGRDLPILGGGRRVSVNSEKACESRLRPGPRGSEHR